MNKPLRIAIVGDFDESRISQIMAGKAIQHVADKLSLDIRYEWVHTSTITDDVSLQLLPFNGVWAGPGDYSNSLGTLRAIQYCREKQIPFLGT